MARGYKPSAYPVIAGGETSHLTGELLRISNALRDLGRAGTLALRDTDNSHTLTIELNSDLTADHTLTLVVPDADMALTLTGNASLQGTNTGDQTITLTGDVTGSGGGSFVATIGNDKVTFAKMQNLGADTLIGAVTAGDPTQITCTAAGRALLDDANSTAQRATLNAATTAQTDFISGIIKLPANQDYRLAINVPYVMLISRLTARTASGTCTVTLKINTTAVTGCAFGASTTETAGGASAPNTVAVGDDIVLTISSASSAVDLSITVEFTRTLA